MPQELPGDQPQICASPGCDEVVVQSDPANKRLYHSAECRRKARRLRHGQRGEADTADLPPVAPPPGRPAADLAPAAELAAAERAARAASASAASAGAALPGSEELPGSEAGHDAVTTPEGRDGTDAADDPGDSEFWNPGNGEPDGFWDTDEEPPRKGARSPGRHRFAATQRSAPGRRSRLKRSHTVAIALTLAASAAGLGLIFSQSGPRQPLASDVQLRPPGLGGDRPSSSSSSSPASHARGHRVSHHAAGGTSHAPRPPAASLSPGPAISSPAPSPTTSATSSPPSPKPSRSPKRTPPPKRTSRVHSGLISFENGADGWKPLYGSIRSSQSTWVADSGSHSLRVTLQGADAAVGVENGSISHLQPGDTVTYHIYSDGQSGGRVGVFAEAWNQPEDVAEVVPLPTYRGWFTLTWVVPSVSHVDAIGIQVAHRGSGTLTLAIDALSWTGS
jgi:hypothetical protein